MNIGTAAARSGLPAKTIRYYEEIGLVRPDRRPNGYRQYRAEDVHKLIFLRRARSLGFSIEDCRQLLSLYDQNSRPSAETRALAAERIAEVEAKLRELTDLKSALIRLMQAADSGQEPDLRDLAGESLGASRDRRRA